MIWDWIKVKKLNKVLSVIVGLGVLITSSVSFTANAATANVYVDNDDSKGHTNYRSGFNTYVTGASHYRRDARTQTTGNNSNVYEWHLDDDRVTASNKIKLYLYAYMNHSSFTDPRAKYSAICSYECTVNSAFNQNTASGGWNLIGTVELTPYTYAGEDTVTLQGACVRPNSNSGYKTAADGVRFYTVTS